MRLHTATANERGLSPVVGVILLVGITVLLAATAGAMVLELDGQPTSPPQAAFDFEYGADGSNDSLTVGHVSGNTIPAANVEVVVASARNGSGTVTTRRDWNELASDDVSEVGSGMSVTVSRDTLGYSRLSLSRADVTVVWTAPNGDQTFVLSEWDGAG